jgi:hypothetical protein
MPRKRRVNKAKAQLTSMEWQFLTDQPTADNFDRFALEIDFNDNIERLWIENRDAILNEHISDNPGTRPALWWRFDAPRSPIGTFPGCYWDSKLPEPRKQLAGSGTPAHEAQAVVPSYSYGIPAWFGADEDDPPVFESQAAYLKRHRLMLAGEEKRSDFEVETTLGDLHC